MGTCATARTYYLKIEERRNTKRLLEQQKRRTARHGKRGDETVFHAKSRLLLESLANKTIGLINLAH
jgi:hypothetical protein